MANRKYKLTEQERNQLLQAYTLCKDAATRTRYQGVYHFFGKGVRWGKSKRGGSMKSDRVKKRWQEKSEEVNQGMVEWRQTHPRATFREIEAEVDRRLDELRAMMLSDTANVGASAEWKEGSEGPVCPPCGAKLEGKGKKKRRLQVRGGNEVEIEREYGKCPECGQGIFPPG